MNRLVAVVGPTGVGKSRLALYLAQALEGEIASADSRQVYRYMDIGTAKPTPDELSLVPHHLIDILKPDEDFSLAQYQQLAYKAIEEINQRGRLPLLVGGSGLYVWSVLEGWKIPAVVPQPGFRRRLEAKAARGGEEGLHQELARLDPVAAQRIDPRNVRRTIRALEVYHSAQAPISQMQEKKAPPFNTIIIGLTTQRQELYRRIDRRVDQMIELGLVDEVKQLLERGYDPGLPAMSGIGYKQVILFLKGKLTLAAAIQQIKSETHRLVRHQYSWFRPKDDRIRWFDIKDKEAEILAWLKKNYQEQE
jgi:tRNA dimethylallyltransferase